MCLRYGFIAVFIAIVYLKQHCRAICALPFFREGIFYISYNSSCDSLYSLAA